MGDDYVSSSASIRISGKHLDFEKIETMLGLKPVTVTRKGTIRSEALGPAKKDVWVYEAKKRSLKPFSNHLTALMEKLTPRRSAIRRLVKEYNVELYCSYHSDMAQGGIAIPPETLKAIADCGLELYISLLSWGGVNNGKTKTPSYLSTRT